MRDWSPIQDAIYTWASEASTYPVIWQHQNAPQPARPYIVLHIDSVNTIQGSSPDETKPNDEGRKTIFFTKDFSVSVMLFGSTDAVANLDNTLSTLWQSNYIDDFAQADIIVLDFEDAKDVSFTEQDHWVEKAVSYINFRTSYDQTYGPDSTTKTINEANIDGKLISSQETDISLDVSISE